LADVAVRAPARPTGGTVRHEAKVQETRQQFSENKQRSITLLQNAISTLEDEIGKAGPVVEAAAPAKEAVQDTKATLTVVEVRMPQPRRWGGIALEAAWRRVGRWWRGRNWWTNAAHWLWSFLHLSWTVQWTHHWTRNPVYAVCDACAACNSVCVQRVRCVTTWRNGWILLETFYLPGDLEAQIEAFVVGYNDRRFHESIDNLTPADVYFGRSQTILPQRERIKRQTIPRRRLQHQRQAA
jgi:hypothetical protein